MSHAYNNRIGETHPLKKMPSGKNQKIQLIFGIRIAIRFPVPFFFVTYGNILQ